jgi:hypothetical protein
MKKSRRRSTHFATTIFGVTMLLSGNNHKVIALEDALKHARALQVPSTESRLGGEQENIDFWQRHQHLLKQAWSQWADRQFVENSKEWNLLEDPDRLLNPTLVERVQQAWENPTLETELAVKELFQQVSPGVYVIEEFFSREGIQALRNHHLDAASLTEIPTRRPNGMNRFGLVLDEDVEGGVSYPQLDLFRHWLIDTYIRPVARSIFPDFTTTSDTEQPNDDGSYTFTVHYSHDGSGSTDSVDDTGGSQEDGDHEDRYLPRHTDASLYTFNINLNFQEEDDPDHPAQLVFYNRDTDDVHTLTMKPGMAVLHRGMHAHQALPLKVKDANQPRRRRDQLIVWLFGGNQEEDYYVRFLPYEKEDQMTVQERWSKPAVQKNENAETRPTGDFPTDWL